MDSSRRQKQAMIQHLEQNNFSKLRHISSKWIQMGHRQISNPQAYGCHQEKKITSMQDNGHWYMKMKRDQRVSLWRSKVNTLTKYSFLFLSSTAHNWTEQICHNQVHPIKNQISPQHNKGQYILMNYVSKWGRSSIGYVSHIYFVCHPLLVLAPCPAKPSHSNPNPPIISLET
jgi:hypothetical protein